MVRFLGKVFLGSSLNHGLELSWNEILISLDFISIGNNFLSIWNCCPGFFVLSEKGMAEKDSYLTFFADFRIHDVHDSTELDKWELNRSGFKDETSVREVLKGGSIESSINRQ